MGNGEEFKAGLIQISGKLVSDGDFQRFFEDNNAGNA